MKLGYSTIRTMGLETDRLWAYQKIYQPAHISRHHHHDVLLELLDLGLSSCRNSGVSFLGTERIAMWYQSW